MFASRGVSHRRPQRRPLLLMLSIASLLAGCPSKNARSEASTETEKAQEVSAITSSNPPLPPGFEDPPASAWDYSKEEELAGLDMHLRGVPLEEAKQIIVLFHGYGADGDDLVDLSTVMDVGAHGAFVFPIAPVELPRGGRAWFRRDRSNFETGVARARDFIAALAERYPQSVLIVGGFSQGAMLTVNLLETSSAPFEAALIWSPADLLITPLKGSRTKTPVFLSHGSVDPILPFLGATRLRDLLERSGYQVTWVPFEGRHTIPRVVIEGVNLFLRALPDQGSSPQEPSASPPAPSPGQ